MPNKEDHDPVSLETHGRHGVSRTESYPEGGLRAWLVVFGAWCAMIPSMGLLNSLGMLHAWTSTHQLQECSESSIGWIYGAYGFFLYFAGAQVGPIFDAYGPVYVILPGSIGIVAAMICLSFSEKYYQIFLSFSVLGGLSASTLFSPVVACVGHWFNTRRGFATGMACTAGGLGGVIFPLIILSAAPKLGFPWAMRIIALLSAVLCTLACLLLKTRLRRHKEAGAAIDFKALRDVNYASTTVAVFLVEFAVFIPITYISSYAIHVGINDTLSYSLIIFLNLGAVPGRFLPGLVADKIGRFNVMIMTSLICSTLTLALWLASGDNLPAIICYAVLFGFWSGAAISLTPVCISQVCETEDYGKRNGTTFTIASIGTLTGIPIAGAIQEHAGGDYWGIIVFGGLLYFAATVGFAVVRGICAGWSFKVFKSLEEAPDINFTFDSHKKLLQNRSIHGNTAVYGLAVAW
ncbi:Oxalate formate antiporter [Aspergillus sclerotialis]|uniref:Oxalate formate antiporter n=1 Tax=Aspergillus sclerotialis TaxID=2070753 RepID=A0A3A2ZRG0_9EURO|nr:Oxalate formate antiporter [Aspergillus sclerotialis]